MPACPNRKGERRGAPAGSKLIYAITARTNPAQANAGGGSTAALELVIEFPGFIARRALGGSLCRLTASEPGHRCAADYSRAGSFPSGGRGSAESPMHHADTVPENLQFETAQWCHFPHR